MPIIPSVYGISSLQRQSRALLDEAKKNPVFLTEKNKVSYVLMEAQQFENLHNEDAFWDQVQSEGCSFWNHKSNDVYNDL